MSLAEANWRWVRGIDVPFDEFRQHILSGTRLSGLRGYSLRDEQDHDAASSGGASVRGAARGGRERDGWRVVQLTDIHLHPDPDHTHPTIGMCVAPTARDPKRQSVDDGCWLTSDPNLWPCRDGYWDIPVQEFARRVSVAVDIDGRPLSGQGQPYHFLEAVCSKLRSEGLDNFDLVLLSGDVVKNRCADRDSLS